MPQGDLDELTGRTTDGVSRGAQFLAGFAAVESAVLAGDRERERAAYADLRQLYDQMSPDERWEVARHTGNAFARLAEVYARGAVDLPAPQDAAAAEVDVRRVVRLAESVAHAFDNYVGGSGLDAKQLAVVVPRLLDDHVHLQALRRAGYGVEEIKRLDAEVARLRGELAQALGANWARRDREADAGRETQATISAWAEDLAPLVRRVLDKAHRRADGGGWTLDWRLRDDEVGALAGTIAREIVEEGAGDREIARPGRETQATISAWAEATFGPAGSNARAIARANREMAELLEHVTADEEHPEAAEEIADIVIVLSRVMTRLGADLQGEVDRKMAVNRARKWRLDGTGHGYHVEDDEAERR